MKTDRLLSALYTLLVVLMIFLCLPALTQAHELRPTVADISVSGETIEVSLRVNLEALISGVGPEHDDSDDAPQASRYNALRSMSPDVLDAEFQAFLPTFLRGISISEFSDEKSSTPASWLPVELGQVTIPPVGDTQVPRDTLLSLLVLANNETAAMSWQWDYQFGPIILRLDSAEVDTHQNSEPFTQYLQSGKTSERIVLAADQVQSSGSTLIDYVIIGFEHIIPKGLDHILFVIGLFLLSPKLRPIVWQVSMFTVAHTVTLALGISGIIDLPASIVEPLIALSITVICIENLLGREIGLNRLVFVFVFGLLHGLGFAGVLSDIGLQPGQFVSSLLAFNVGVEIGQLTVVLACYALVGWWFGNKPWYRKVVVIPGSVMIGAVGLFWFVQRVSG